MDDSLDRIVESLSQISVNLESLRVSLMGLTEIKSDHEQRLRSIERWKFHLTPLVTLLTFVFGAICTVAIQKSL
jgi:hypothetical protein